MTHESNLHGIRNVNRGYRSTIANRRSEIFFGPSHRIIWSAAPTYIRPRRFPVEIVRSRILPKYQQQNRLLVTVVTMVFRTALTSAARRMTLAAASQVSLHDVYQGIGKERKSMLRKSDELWYWHRRMLDGESLGFGSRLLFEEFVSALPFVPLDSLLSLAQK